MNQPQVYDFNSPRVPSIGEIRDILNESLAVIQKRQLWIIAGIKTRQEAETFVLLKNMVTAAQGLRKQTVSI